jgi:cysteine-rich repeat protein
VDGDEECDDANTEDGDGCDSNCNLEVPVIAPPAAAPAEEVGAPGKAAWFDFDPKIIDVVVRQGQTITQTVKVTNSVTVDMNVVVDYSEFERFMVIKDTEFSLKVNESKIIEIEIFAGEDEIPDVFEGVIRFTGNNLTQRLETIIEVKEKRALFDVVTKVLTKGVKPGGEVTAEISMSNIGDLGPLEATLYNAVKDFEGNVIVDSEETLVVGETLVVERSLTLPDDIEPREDYLFYSRLTYEESMATSADAFRVTRKGVISVFAISMIIIIVLVIIVMILIKKNVFALLKSSRAATTTAMGTAASKKSS